MSDILSYFPEYKLSTITIYRQTKVYDNAGQVSYTDSAIFTGSGWFWNGGDAEVFENQQEKNLVSYQLILDPKDVTTLPEQDDVLTVNGVSDYRLGKPQVFFNSAEVFLYTVNKRVGV